MEPPFGTMEPGVDKPKLGELKNQLDIILMCFLEGIKW
jgi:hypothetical protein